jgi:protein-S-isoprenylcysteine O-methyltransferase Ste14
MENMKNKIPPPIILLLAGIAMWFVAHSEYAYKIAIPFALVIAIALAASGVFISASAIRQFGSAETTISPLEPDTATSLVHTGVFRRTRNPMYVGLLLVLSGWMIWLQSVSNLVVLFAFLFWLNELQIKPEEAALRKVFGQGYIDYCKRVRRWF